MTVSENANPASPQTRDLPYMTEQEFEDFLKNNTDMELGENEIEYLRTRRRRKSVEMDQDEKNQHKKQYAASTSDEKKDVKLVFVGSDETSGCLENLNTLYMNGKELPEKLAPLCVFKQFSEYYNEKTETTDQCRVEIWCPPSPESELEEFSDLRQDIYMGTDAFIVLYSIDEYKSYEDLKEKWIPEVLNSISQQYSIPILLVGTKAELRKETQQKGLITSEDAVKLAQENGLTKYMEIFHQNIHHLKVLVKQAVEASLTAGRRLDETEYQTKKRKKKEYFRELRPNLIVPTPEASFDLFKRRFSVREEENVTYLYTLDGSDPDRTSSVYEYPLDIGDNPPSQIKIFGLTKGKIPSPISIVDVPETSEDPVGHFNPLTKAFHLKTKQEAVYYYTLDGTTPDQDSEIYSSPGILFDNNEPGEAFTSNWMYNIPHSIKMISQEEGKFRSGTVEFKSFETLDPPKVRVYEKDKILTITSAPGVECRYTLDGTTPRYDSPIYTQPLMLPSDVSFSQIRVAAFPKTFFPSKTVAVSASEVTSSPKKTNKPWTKPPPPIKMNKSTLATKSSPPPPAQYGKIFDESHKLVTSPGTKSFPRRSPPKQPQIKYSKEDHDYSIFSTGGSMFEKKKLLLDNSTKKELQVDTEIITQDEQPMKVRCFADAEEVEFEFPQEVLLSNIEVCLPYKREGPAGYECYAVDENYADIVPIGAGDLEESQGSQELNIVGAKNTPLHKVVCNFKRSEGQTSFKLVDIKLKGVAISSQEQI
eukprot:gb/GECH01011332.1/.p1 GENE.gb/GECH01011332.1/~~gb/GECH01011332.1/.p1  ORF type:complete len:761 (+),score=174.98 gb/GECH01011332.1/:1-2283(+)